MSRSAQGTFFRLRHRLKRRGSGHEFASFRDYVMGDDFRMVDASASLRLNQLLLRTYEDEEHFPIYILVDVSQSMGHHASRKLNCAKRIAAAIACMALATKERVTLVGFSGADLRVQPASGGPCAWLTVLRFLEQLEPAGPTQHYLALCNFVRQFSRRGVAVLVSDCFDPEGYEPGLEVLRHAGFETQVWHVVDDEDAEIRCSGDITAVDCETAVECLVTVTEAFRERLRVAHRQFAENLDRHCRANGVDYTRCNVAVPFERIVIEASRARGSIAT